MGLSPAGPTSASVKPNAVPTRRATSVDTWRKHTRLVGEVSKSGFGGRAPKVGHGSGLVSSSATAVGNAANMAAVSIGGASQGRKPSGDMVPIPMRYVDGT